MLEAKLTTGDNHIILASKEGYAVRFHEEKVRPMGRTAAGVRGILIDTESGNEVIGMVSVQLEDNTKTLLVVSEKGNGKRSEINEYRETNRGGKGVKTLQVTDKTGKLVTIKAVEPSDDLMIINKSGIVIRMAVADLPILGRATQGVRVIRLDENDDIADVAITDLNSLPRGGNAFPGATRDCAVSTTAWISPCSTDPEIKRVSIESS